MQKQAEKGRRKKKATKKRRRRNMRRWKSRMRNKRMGRWKKRRSYTDLVPGRKAYGFGGAVTNERVVRHGSIVGDVVDGRQWKGKIDWREGGVREEIGKRS